MNNTNWDEFRCRCSAISKIMANTRSNPQLTEKQTIRLNALEARDKLTDKMKLEVADLLVKKANSPKIILSDSCIAYLMEYYAWETEGMISVGKESLENFATEKGRKVEGQAADLLGFVDNVVYKVHKERIFNDYLSGEVDLYLGNDIYSATNITDIKNASDYPKFLVKISNPLEKDEEEQVQGYMDITGAREGFIANCLVDSPEEQIEDMKWKIARRMNAVTVESPEFLREWAKWERSMKFSHIPPNKRVHKLPVEPFSSIKQQQVYDRVKVCREWLWKFDEMYNKLNIQEKVLLTA